MRPPNSMEGKGAGRWSLTLDRMYLYISRGSSQAKVICSCCLCGPQIYFRTGSQSEGASWGPRNMIGMVFLVFFFPSVFVLFNCV